MSLLQGSLPLYHVHVGNCNVATVTAEPDESKVFEQFAADGTSSNQEIFLSSQFGLEFRTEHSNLTVISEIKT